ncbi:hypothetical protein EDB82DRAFT_422537, partial [Fusarium venenatum]|uniref:uncharacterized protein n=1 Tax=Fusarium venenatum TaxID=56646 RepID=UPI001D50B222
NKILDISIENIIDTKLNIVIKIILDSNLILIVSPEEIKLYIYSTLLIVALKPFSIILGLD